MTSTAQLVRRKCRKCGVASLVAFFVDRCPKCRAEYGGWELGFDQEVIVETAPLKRRR